MAGELSLIEMIRRKSLKQNGLVRVGIGDDAAVLRVNAGDEIVITTDFSLENVHFADFHPAASIGHRCLARGLSDIAAMGARPVAAFLSLALSKEWARKPAKTRGFMKGLLQLADGFGVTLAGGDTAGSPAGTVADIIVLGMVKRGKALLRSGAKPGDGIYITGSLGGAAVELEQLRTNPTHFARVRPNAAHPHLYPQPRIAVGQKLIGIASACMDMSDGLSTDLHHLCRASGVGAEIEAALLPVATGATLDQALYGGEDYELLFTSPKNLTGKIAGVDIQRVGHVTASREIFLISQMKKKRLKAGGWEHLR